METNFPIDTEEGGGMNLLIGIAGLMWIILGLVMAGQALEELHPAFKDIWYGYIFIVIGKGLLAWANEDKKK